MEDPERIYPYILSELEVFGSGGPVAIPKEQPAVGKDGRLYLAGGNWKIQRESLVRNTAEEIASAGYDDTGWIAATVPATVLMSYYNIGALPDPDFGDINSVGAPGRSFRECLRKLGEAFELSENPFRYCGKLRPLGA